MKFSFASIVAVLAASAVALPTSESPSMEARTALEARATTCSKAATDKLIFKVSMKTFQKARKSKNPSKCVWKNDGCSWSPDKPSGFNFLPSCQRHDFGYRNTKKQKRFTKAMKKKVDNQFKKDLYKYCSQFSGIWSYKGVQCRRTADVYVAAVRKFGKRENEQEERSIVVEDFQFTKRDESVLDIEVDADIPGQEIPDVLPENDDGLDVDDLDAFLGDE
ncbi:hypothetical protein K4F52_009824 [Lecanicillium sp. MT-2017a]|nr:hypothetical protein K4F52_009824 [Lecanicillium sp. MT-2017a]